MAIQPRISENYRYASNMDRISNSKANAEDINETAASGRKLKRISDDPISTVKVLKNRGRIANIDQFRKTIDFGKGFLTKTEDALSSISESLSRAKEICIQQSNSTYDDASRFAVAQEIRQILNHVTLLGNSKYNDKYIFGGFQTNQPPIAPDGSYLGDDGLIYVQIDEDSFRPINISGRNIFGVPIEAENTRPNLVKILENVFYSLENYNPELLHQSMNHLDIAMDTIIANTASIGGKQVALQDASERIDKSEVQLHYDTNNLESTDMVKSAIDLKRAEHALQFTMQASGKMLSPTLLDFLR